MSVHVPVPVYKLMPWPYEASGARVDGLDFSVKIQGAGGWFDLEDGRHYAVHGDSFANYSMTYRTTLANSPWLEGSYPIGQVRENVTEPLVVWTRGETANEERIYREKLISAVEQLSWMLMVRYEDVAEYWQCWGSEYAVERQREFVHARISVVRITVSRLPAKQIVDATSDEQ